MTLISNSLSKILNEIGDELTSQISLVKNTDTKIDTKKLLQQSKILDDLTFTPEVIKENKSMLRKFALTLQDSSTPKNLRYEKQDLERIMEVIVG
ncbi:MAG: hypothetical protein K5777_05355 [Nitrosopumilus sp.]|nr:hypothetical protein [Nitrosopumilus sp.]